MVRILILVMVIKCGGDEVSGRYGGNREGGSGDGGGEESRRSLIDVLVIALEVR